MTFAEPPWNVERDVGGRPRRKCRSTLTHSHSLSLTHSLTHSLTRHQVKCPTKGMGMRVSSLASIRKIQEI